ACGARWRSPRSRSWCSRPLRRCSRWKAVRAADSQQRFFVASRIVSSNPVPAKPNPRLIRPKSTQTNPSTAALLSLPSLTTLHLSNWGREFAHLLDERRAPLLSRLHKLVVRDLRAVNAANTKLRCELRTGYVLPRLERLPRTLLALDLSNNEPASL